MVTEGSRFFRFNGPGMIREKIIFHYENNGLSEFRRFTLP